ncbi:MAG: phosphoribosyltransferase family protein [Campylobacterota bacterium]|nr:phosphoribosyltransferase family protein [Campylobacterota bacterium]
MKIEKLLFKNREEAAKSLYEILPYDDMLQEDWIVIAVSDGGVPIASKIAKNLNANLDFLFTEKIFTEKNNECEIAIITETTEIVIHEELMKSFKLDLEKIYKQADEKYNKEIKSYKAKYRNSLDIISLDNKNVLLVDEGLNTGLTMMACIKSVVNKKAKSVCVAVPILPKATVNDIETIADDLYYVQAPEHFVSIDFYYEDLEKVNLKNININNKG